MLDLAIEDVQAVFLLSLFPNLEEIISRRLGTLELVQAVAK